MLEVLIIQSLEFLAAGGAVMWPLVALSIWMWWLIGIKGLELLTWRRKEKPVHVLVHEQIRGAQWQEEILELVRSLPDHAAPPDARVLKKLTRGLEARIDHSLQTILLLAGAAPLLGLFGTVCGMITTFEVIAGFGTGNARAMAGGISEALIQRIRQAKNRETECLRIAGETIANLKGIAQGVQIVTLGWEHELPGILDYAGM